MEEAPTPLNITQQGKKISISKKIEINENNGKQKLNIIIEKDYIIFKILYQEPILNEYSCKYSLNEIKSLHKMFSSISSFNEFFDYINNLSINNRISIQKQEGFIIINLEAEYLFKKYNIQMKLFKEKLDIELNFINVFKQLTGLKNLIKTIYNENKILKEELAQKKNEIKKLFEDNNNLKTEKEKVDKLLKEKNDNENIILLNKQLLVFKTHLDENIKKFEKQINELEIKINEIHKKTNHINIDEINKLKIKFEDMEKSTNKMFESIRLNYNENKKLLFNNNEKEQKTYDLKKVLEDFENLLIIIISSEENEEIGKENLEKFKNISRILIKNKISPIQILSKYFKDNNKIAKNNNEIDFKILERISKLQMKLIDILYDIEFKLII